VIFVDSSFWIAARLRRDTRHNDAGALLERYQAEPLVTSNHVAGETWTFLRRRDSHRGAVAFLTMIERTPRLRVVFVSEQLEQQAIRWLRRHDERPYSFVDGTSFALMKTLRVRNALAFDGDFSAAGFVELRA
jgi:predicted nucleic acid-binding protein